MAGVETLFKVFGIILMLSIVGFMASIGLAFGITFARSRKLSLAFLVCSLISFLLLGLDAIAGVIGFIFLWKILFDAWGMITGRRSKK